jgi:hypothetical protein
MKTRTVLTELASSIVARLNCAKTPETHAEWFARHGETIDRIAKELLPSGSGIDSGTKVDLDKSDGRSRIVLETAFHHMNDGGMYDGWTEHTITITPDLLFGFSLRISGRDRNQIKEYLHDVFTQALDAEYVQEAVS